MNVRKYDLCARLESAPPRNKTMYCDATMVIYSLCKNHSSVRAYFYADGERANGCRKQRARPACTPRRFFGFFVRHPPTENNSLRNFGFSLFLSFFHSANSPRLQSTLRRIRNKYYHIFSCRSFTQRFLFISTIHKYNKHRVR